MTRPTLLQLIYVFMTSSTLQTCTGRPLVGVTGASLPRRRAVVADNHVTFRPGSFAQDDVTQLTSIIESFDKLGFLLASSCYEVDLVERTLTAKREGPNIDPKSTYVTISVRLRTVPASNFTSGVVSDWPAAVTCSRTMTSTAVPARVSDVTVTMPPLLKQSVTRKQLLQSVFAVNSTSQLYNVSVDLQNGENVDNNHTWNDKRKGNFGSTQVLVMGLCSAIIGVFFVAVVTLRIRNYCRRVFYKPKEERHYRRPGQHKRSPVVKTTSNRGGAYSVNKHPLL